jgi:hypothetical protein
MHYYKCPNCGKEELHKKEDIQIDEYCDKDCFYEHLKNAKNLKEWLRMTDEEVENAIEMHNKTE